MLCTAMLGIGQYTRTNLTICLETSCEQVVFALLFTSCQQVWNKLLTCSKVVDIVRLGTRLFQQGCYNHDITILLQPCVVKLVTFLLYHDCIRLVRRTCNKSDNAIQACYKLLTTCSKLVTKNQKRAVQTQLVKRLVTNLCIFTCVLQGCSKRLSQSWYINIAATLVLSTLWQSCFS